MKPNILLIVSVSGLLIAGCAAPGLQHKQMLGNPPSSGQVESDQSRPVIEPTRPDDYAALQSSPREHRVTPTWTASPAATDSMPVTVFEAVVGTELSASAAAPGGKRPAAALNAAEFNSPLPTLPNSPLPTPPDSPLPTPTDWPLPPSSEAPSTPTEISSMTPTGGPTATPTRTGSPTITRTPTGSVTPTGSTTPSPTITRGAPPWTPTHTFTPTGTRAPSMTPIRESPTATSPSSPVSTPTPPDSPLPTPTPTGTCCYDCDC